MSLLLYWLLMVVVEKIIVIDDVVSFGENLKNHALLGSDGQFLSGQVGIFVVQIVG